MKKSIYLIILIFSLFLISCSQKDLSAENVLKHTYPDLNLSSGHLYLSNSTEGSENYMSPALFSVMYSKNQTDGVPKTVEEYAIFVSSFELPFEIAVFRCYSPSSCDEIEKLCLSRLDALKKFYKNSEYSQILNDAFVMRDGKFVIAVISQDQKSISDSLKKILH